MERILLLGSGGREHALAWKIAQSPKLEKLFIAPGNAGTALVGENVAMKADDFEAIKTFVLANAITMVVVGPEDPLVKGIYDYFKSDAELASIPVVGPSKQGAVLEGSKDFAKGFMQRHAIPTAAYQTFTGETLEEGKAFLEQFINIYSAVVFDSKYEGFVSQIMVEGHTDTSGGYDLNLQLSQARAESVRDYCLSVAADHTDALSTMLSPVGFSYTDPVYGADGKVDMAASRRVAFRFLINLAG